MWFGAGVSVNMVLEGGKSLEATLANTALVWPFFRVGLHVPGQQVPFWTCVVAVVAHVRLSNSLAFLWNNFDDFGLVVLFTGLLQ